MNKLVIGLIAITSLSAFAQNHTFSCEITYTLKDKNQEIVQTDVLSSRGQQSSKIEGFVSQLYSHLVYNKDGDSLGRHYYFVLNEVVPGFGLRTINSLLITQSDLDSPFAIDRDLNAGIARTKNTTINTRCFKDGQFND